MNSTKRSFLLLSLAFTGIFPEISLARESSPPATLSAPRENNYARANQWNWRLGLGIETRMIADVSKEAEYAYKNAPVIFIALGKNWFQTQTELSRWIEGGARGLYSIGSERREGRQWFRYVVRPESRSSAHIGLSYGLYQTSIETKFYNQLVRSSSDPKSTFGAEIGAQIRIVRRLFAEINLRALKDEESQERDVLAGAQVKIGYIF